MHTARWMAKYSTFVHIVKQDCLDLRNKSIKGEQRVQRHPVLFIERSFIKIRKVSHDLMCIWNICYSYSKVTTHRWL